MPTFRNGYNKRLDLTEDEYLAQLMDTADELDDSVAWCVEGPEFEGEPHEDTYLPGIADYDRFNRPSWET